jgi:nifR3 family TIM-barrel protein
MAGVSNLPFRLVCKELGSSLTTSEELSAAAIVHLNGKTLDLAAYLPEEKPIAMQLLGSEPRLLAQAAEILVDKGADIIDLNMGCPVPKVTKLGAGAALMKDPSRAAEVFYAIRHAVDVPFTIKVRGGWDDQTVNAPEIARLAEAEGVDAVAVHPRTRSQQYTGLAPWDVIRRVVEAVKIPVTGNGDVKSHADAERMMSETGCKSVMIGRAALGRPWVFDAEFEKLPPAELHDAKFRIILRHMELIAEHMEPRVALTQMKKHLVWYAVGLPDAASSRNRIFTTDSAEELLDFFGEWWNRPVEAN